MKSFIAILGICLAPASYAAELVKACDVGTHPAHRVEIIRDSQIASTHIYYLRQSGKRTPLFESPERSRGDSVLAECVGKKSRALIVSGEFTANARQGFVITYHPGSEVPERLDFAEKATPHWIYLGPQEIIVVIPTFGYGETDAKYVAYRHLTGQIDGDRVDAMNQLPAQSGFEVIRLKSSVR